MSLRQKSIAVLLASSFAFASPLWAQGVDLSKLPVEQLNQLNIAQQNQARARQPSPVSAPMKPAPAGLSPVFGFETAAGSAGSLRPFGEFLFSGGVVPFAASSDMPVPLDYVVGVGDIVELRLYGKENRTYQIPVDRSGQVTLPEIGPVQVAGLTFESVGKVILERIAKQKIGVEATVSMGALRSLQVFLMGDVNHPGAYAMDSLTTVVNALLIGGGLKSTGSMRKVEVRRKGALIARVDLYDALLRGGDKSGLRLQSGDTIFVPAVGKRVGVGGEVLRPAIYELLNEKSADDVIALAGGLLPSAFAAQSRVDRIGRDGARQLIDLPLNSPVLRKAEVLDGDVISIPSVLARWDKSVSVMGSVNRPGGYEWKQDMHLGGVIGSFDQLPRDTYRPLAIIERTDAASGARQLRTIDLPKVVQGKLVEPLEPGDRIVTLSHADIEYLSSASVQLVLSRRLPLESAPSQAAMIVQEKSVEKAPADEGRRAAKLDAVDELKRAERQESELAGQKQRTSQQECRGLIELSEVIHREGVERFRAAIMNSNQLSERPHLVKNLACPEIFQRIPELLPFVLENSITVRGEVKQPGVLPIPEGLTLDVALNARGGFTREADRTGIEVSRQAIGKLGRAGLKRHLVKPEELTQVALEPGNVVVVLKRFSEMDTGVVRLSGEFAHPGSYEIRRGEKLSEVIARAGGVTHQAYPQGAVFLRQSIKQDKRQYYEKAALDLQNSLVLAMTRQRSAGSTSTDAGAATVVMNLVNQMRSVDPVGRMVVEADPTVLQVRPELDVMMEVGDEVYIPRRPSSILVMGEVQNPGAVQFHAGKKPSDYIAAVGGLTRLADEDRIFAILPNGSADPLKLSSWNFQPKLLPPGSVIYVAREPLPTTSTDLLLLSLQVVKDLALSAASLSVISK